MTAVIFYNDLMAAATLSATSEATGFEKELAFDWNAWTWWKGAAAGTLYLTADLGSAQSVDCGVIYAHNLPDVSGSAQLEYSTDNFSTDINQAFSAVTPSTTRPIIETFTSLSKRYWRWKFVTTGSAPRIGIAGCGPRLDLPTGIGPGFAPPLHGYMGERKTGRTVDGVPLPISLKAKMAKTPLHMQLLTQAWVAANWDAFADHAQSTPFFFKPGIETDDGAFCQHDGNLPAPTLRTPLFYDVTLKVMALTR